MKWFVLKDKDGDNYLTNAPANFWGEIIFTGSKDKAVISYLEAEKNRCNAESQRLYDEDETSFQYYDGMVEGISMALIELKKEN